VFNNPPVGLPYAFSLTLSSAAAYCIRQLSRNPRCVEGWGQL